MSRWIMEKHLGRKLKSDEVVHHIDENPYNNNLKNLQVMARAEHIRHHATGRQKSAETIKKWRASIPSRKLEQNANWRGGRSLPKQCKDCGVQTNYRSILCKSCSMKRTRKRIKWSTKKKI